MRSSLVDPDSPLCTTQAAPATIALGLTILIAHVVFPLLPIATAFAIVALGASLAIVSRSARRTVIASNLLVYAFLYLLFVGAICDGAIRTSARSLSILQTIDLGLSAGIMAFISRTCLTEIVGPTQ
jgi:hypothetical protein